MNNPISYADPSGHSIVGAMFFGAVIGFLSVYIPDVMENAQDGFQASDLWTFRKDNLLEYGVNIIGGALTGLIGELGMSILISAPLVGAINTGVAYVSGDIDTWQEGLDHFLQSTLIAGLTLGSKNMSKRIPKIGKVSGLNTKLNNFINKTVSIADSTLSVWGQYMDDTTSVLILTFGVINTWKRLNSL